jgi:D-apiose dehydrogenase
MTQRRTIAIVGLGAAAQRIHLPAYRKTANLDLVGGCDSLSGALEGQFSFPVFPDIKSLIDNTRPDIVTIATPTPDHFDLVRYGLEQGCHILCEKPFTSSLEEARELIRLSAQVNRWVVVNNQFRFMEIYQAARAKIGTPEFGELLFLSANQTFFVNEATEAGWRGEDPQRTCKEFGIHVLDLCRYFFGEEPFSIYCKMQRLGDAPGPDYLNLIQLEFPGNRLAQITLDRLSRGRHRYLDLRLDGTNATVETEFGGRLEASAGIRGGTRKPFVNFDFSPGGSAKLFRGEVGCKIASDPLDIFANATRKLVTAYLEALDNNTVPPCSARDNIKTLALMLAAYESDKSGQAVPFASQWADFA